MRLFCRALCIQSAAESSFYGIKKGSLMDWKPVQLVQAPVLSMCICLHVNNFLRVKKNTPVRFDELCFYLNKGFLIAVNAVNVSKGENAFFWILQQRYFNLCIFYSYFYKI